MKRHKTITQHLRERLEAKAGIIPGKNSPLPINVIRKMECDDGFTEMMDNRLVMGSLRYGPCRRRVPQHEDLVRCVVSIELYLESGNTEHLVDAANYARLEAKRGFHPTKHFRAIDRDETIS